MENGKVVILKLYNGDFMIGTYLTADLPVPVLIGD